MIPIHKNESLYKDADQFDGFRFSKLREVEHNAKYNASNTSLEYLQFGHGQHAWYLFPVF